MLKNQRKDTYQLRRQSSQLPPLRRFPPLREGNRGGACVSPLREGNRARVRFPLLARIGVKQLGFCSKKVLQRALRSFNLAGKHRLFAHIHVNKEVGVRQRENSAVQPPQRVIRL
jgi:hypothetical protein